MEDPSVLKHLVGQYSADERKSCETVTMTISVDRVLNLTWDADPPEVDYHLVDKLKAAVLAKQLQVLAEKFGERPGTRAIFGAAYELERLERAKRASNIDADKARHALNQLIDELGKTPTVIDEQ
jgi:hypothetical protein